MPSSVRPAADGAWVVDLDAVEPLADEGLVGRKAAAVAGLRQAGFAVPPGLCVTTRAFEAFLATLEPDLRGRLTALIHSGAAMGRLPHPEQVSEVTAAVLAQAVPERLVADLQQHLARIDAPRGWTLRTSATLQGLDGASFAGVFFSQHALVGVQEIVRAIKRCWATLWSEPVAAYCQATRIRHTDMALGCLLQPTLDVTRSGSILTMDPLGGRESLLILEATLGFGDSLVRGLVEPDRFTVDRRTRVAVDVRVGTKVTRLVLTREGLTREPSPEDQRQAPCLSLLEVYELARLGDEVQLKAGAPREVEWAIDGSGSIALLQSRPITRYATQALRGRWRAADFRAGVPFDSHLSPLTWSLLHDAWERAIPAYFDGLGLLGGNARASTHWVHLYYGRPYWNIGALREVLAAAPGLAADSFEIDLATNLGDEGVMLPLVGRGHRPRGAMRRVLDDLFKKQIRGREEQRTRLEERLAALDAVDLESLGLNSLARLSEDLVETVYRPGEQAYVWALFSASIARLSFRTIFDEIDQVEGGRFDIFKLMGGIESPYTRDLMVPLWGLADAVRAEPDLHRRLVAAPSAEIGGLLEGHPVGASLGELLRRFSFRSTGGVELGRPRWGEAPAALYRLFQEILRCDDEQADPRVQRREETREYALERAALLEAAARHRPWWRRSAAQVERVARALDYMRRLAAWKEDLRLLTDRIYGALRRYALAVEKRLLATRRLARPGDVFLLSWDTLRAAMTGDVGRAELSFLTAAEGRAWSRFRHFQPAMELIGGATPAQEEDDRRGLRGIGVAPARGQGRARLVCGGGPADVRRGEVLVCDHATIPWALLGLRAAGLVSEAGGLTCQPAILAREFGIPAVFGVRNAFEHLTPDLRLEVDGARGRVRFLDPAPPS